MMVAPITPYRISSGYSSNSQVSSEHKEIMEELEKYGISPTGIKSVDEDMLEQIKAEQAAKTNKVVPPAKNPVNFDEISMNLLKDLLDKMSISSTNDVERDVLNVSNNIKDKLLSKDLSDQERSLYISYKINLDRVISQTGIAVGIFVLTDEMRGATQLGEENKKLLKI